MTNFVATATAPDPGALQDLLENLPSDNDGSWAMLLDSAALRPTAPMPAAAANGLAEPARQPLAPQPQAADPADTLAGMAGGGPGGPGPGQLGDPRFAQGMGGPYGATAGAPYANMNGTGAAGQHGEAVAGGQQQQQQQAGLQGAAATPGLGPATSHDLGGALGRGWDANAADAAMQAAAAAAAQWQAGQAQGAGGLGPGGPAAAAPGYPSRSSTPGIQQDAGGAAAAAAAATPSAAAGAPTRFLGEAPLRRGSAASGSRDLGLPNHPQERQQQQQRAAAPRAGRDDGHERAAKRANRVRVVNCL